MMIPLVVRNLACFCVRVGRSLCLCALFFRRTITFSVIEKMSMRFEPDGVCAINHRSSRLRKVDNAGGITMMRCI